MLCPHFDSAGIDAAVMNVIVVIIIIITVIILN
jgi:hypothetical protein